MSAPLAWQMLLARLRLWREQKLQPMTNYTACSDDLTQEALMTIIAIMKDGDDPKLQMAAAKMLLDKRAKHPALGTLVSADTYAHAGAQDSARHDSADTFSNPDIESAMALAKELLDELARRKTQELDSARQVALAGAGGAVNT